MKNWKVIDYLAEGNRVQKNAYKAIKELKIFDVLSCFNPILVGTIPIEIDIEGSDLDIVCEVYDFEHFEKLVRITFGKYDGFKCSGLHEDNHMVVNFFFMGFEFELYAASASTESFNGYRHMLIENRIIGLLGQEFKRAVIDLKKSGLKTEPAFARLLNISGDPYEGLLDLESHSDLQIQEMYD